MGLRQLRSLVTLVQSGFNVSRAAEHLHLVQPAVSQHLRQLEEELQVPLYQRHGKRLVGLTETGEEVLAYARDALAAAANIMAVVREHTKEEAGVLRIATTHTQARYVLPSVIRRFSAQSPRVAIEIHQGTPAHLIDLVVCDAVDLAVCTEGLSEHPALIAVPCYRWNRCLVARGEHPALKHKPLTLEVLCSYPLITYVFGFTGRGNMSTAFAREGLSPNVVLGAADTDVIKTYVREGMGLGIIADMAYQPDEDSDLQRRDLSHLFPWEVTKIAYRRNNYLRGFQKHFIDIFQAETAGLGQVRRTPARTC